MATSDTLVQNEPAFVLHSVPYRETSLVVEMLTRSHGRLACVAKGAKRPRSTLRAVLLAFQPLRIAYRGRQELRTLTAVEWVGGLPAPQGDALLCSFYLNELLLRLLARDDPHPALFDGYVDALAGLGAGPGGADIEPALRRFEWLLLREIGYAVDLERDAEQRPIAAERRYRLHPGQGFWVADGADERSYAGQTLRDMAAGDYDSPQTLSEAKRLTRVILAQHLEGATLKTRQILRDLQKL
jgi:DNA repair protein RecO (recombination protein O)